jgi:hypothetical protein
VLDPAVTPRRIANALAALPAGCWPEPDHPGSWSITDHLLATLIDEVRQLTWLTARVGGSKNAPRPEPIARPGAKAAAQVTKPRQSWGDFARQLVGIAKRNG